MYAIQHSRYGAPHVLTLTEQAAPEPGPGEILVEVLASPVTQGDRRLRAADFPGISWLPGRLMMGLLRPKHRTPGTQFAGRVAALGAGVTRFAVGDRVFGSCPHGAHAERLVVGADGPVAHTPASVSDAEAAATPYGAVTALIFLRDLARVQPGERVLIVGAAGEVGRFAVQLARHLGAEVTGLASAADHALLRSLGATHVIDRAEADSGLAAHGPWDVIFDTPGALPYSRAKHHLTDTGRYLSLHVTLRLLIQMALTARGRGRKAIFGAAFGDREHLETVADLIARGALAPTLGPIYPLARAADAHAHLEDAKPRGSVILVTPAQEADTTNRVQAAA